MVARKGDKITQHITSMFINETNARNHQLKQGIIPGKGIGLVDSKVYIRVKQTTIASQPAGTLLKINNLSKSYDGELNEKTANEIPTLDYDSDFSGTSQYAPVALLLEPLPGVEGETALAIISGLGWLYSEDITSIPYGDTHIINVGSTVQTAPNGPAKIIASQGNLFLVLLGGYQEVAVFFRYELLSDWAAGSAECERFGLSGSYQKNVYVEDPENIMTDQVTGDRGYMFYQDGRYIAIQAPC